MANYSTYVHYLHTKCECHVKQICCFITFKKLHQHKAQSHTDTCAQVKPVRRQENEMVKCFRAVLGSAMMVKSLYKL